jgi:5'-3' exonuclease
MFHLKVFTFSNFKDNLYLDLNGVVHFCIHGNDRKKLDRTSSLDDFEEIWANITRYIDEIV